MDEEERVKGRYDRLHGFLDERSQRLLAGAESAVIGRGGIALVARATGLARNTIFSGIRELKGGKEDRDKAKGVRRKGGGRKRLEHKDPKIKKDLESLIEPVTRGDPESSLLWTSKSLRKLSAELKKKGHQISHRVVGELLKEMNYSLQANRKRFEGGDHLDRDQQFEYIYEKTKLFQMECCPVISVDTKKKELVGLYKNTGKEWNRKGNPQEVNVYDFSDKELGKAIPYGVYDMTKNQGWVSVGSDQTPQNLPLIQFANGGSPWASRFTHCLLGFSLRRMVEAVMDPESNSGN